LSHFCTHYYSHIILPLGFLSILHIFIFILRLLLFICLVQYCISVTSKFSCSVLSSCHLLSVCLSFIRFVLFFLNGISFHRLTSSFAVLQLMQLFLLKKHSFFSQQICELKILKCYCIFINIQIVLVTLLGIYRLAFFILKRQKQLERSFVPL
jgi:hypothetical protein